MSFTYTTTDPVFAHGKKSGLGVGASGGTDFCINKFEYDIKYDEHDATSTCNGGQKSFQTGLTWVEFSGEGQLNLSATPVSVMGGGGAVAIDWYADDTVGSPTALFSCATCIVPSIKITGAVEGIITFTFSGKSSGSFTAV